MLAVTCTTRFDITATGVRSTFRENQIPTRTQDGQTIQDHQAWTRARNQQRNWETVMQIISLRCLPENITLPQRLLRGQHATWQFSFSVPDPAAIEIDQDPVGYLRRDCQGVPMIQGLDETSQPGAVLDPGPGGNIEFAVLPINM